MKRQINLHPYNINLNYPWNISNLYEYSKTVVHTTRSNLPSLRRIRTLHGSRLNSREFSFPEFPAKLIGTRNQTRLPDVIYPHDNYIASKEKETVRSDRGSTESRRQRERIVEGGGGAQPQLINRGVTCIIVTIMMMLVRSL